MICRRLVLPSVEPACILVLFEWVILVWNISSFSHTTPQRGKPLGVVLRGLSYDM